MADEREITIRLSAKNLSGAEFDKVRKDIGGIGKSADDFSSKGAGIAGSFRTALGVVGTAATVAAAAIGAAAAATVVLGQRGAEVADLQGSFDTLNEAIGNNADTLLNTLRSAMRGTVADAELFAASNLALGQGLELNEEQFDLTAKTARVLADRIGGDTAGAYKTLLDAMASGRDMTLKTVGLNIDAKAATEAYAASIGKTSGELTESEQIIAKKNAILAEMQRALEISGEAEVDFADHVDQARTILSNLRDEVALSIAENPVLAAGLGAVGDAVLDAFGETKEARVAALQQAISAVAMFIVDSASVVVEWGRTAARVFAASQIPVRALTVAFVSMVERVGSGIAALAELAADLPGVGGAFEGVAVTARGTADAFGGVLERTRGLLNGTIDLARGQGEVYAGFDKVQGVLQDVKAAMVEASLTTTAGTTALRNQRPAQEQHVTLTKAQQKALDEAEKAATKFRESVRPMGPAMAAVALGGGATWIATNYELAQSITDTASDVRAIGGDLGDLASDTAIADQGFQQFASTVRASGDSVVSTTRKVFGDITDSLPQVILGAIQGGGNVFASVGAAIGGGIGTNVVKHFGDAIKGKLGDLLGGALSSILPGVGALLGPLMGKLGSIFGGVSKEVKQARADVAAFEDKLHDTLTATQLAEAGNERWAMTTIAVRDAYLAMGKSEDEAYAATERLWESSRRGPEASAAAIAEVNAVLEDQQALMAEVEESNFTWQELQQQAEEYGVDLAALGPQFASAKLNEKAASLITFLERARSAGADWGAVLMGTRDEIGELIGEARRMGIALPENMRPFINDLFASGNLLDENGNKIEDISDLEFTEPLEIKVGTLIDEIRELVREMSRIPTRVETEVHRRYTESGERDIEGGDGARNYDRGTRGVHGTYFPNFGAGGELVRVHNEEMILPRQDLPEFLRAVAPAMAAPAAGSSMTMHVVFDDDRRPREVTEHEFTQIQGRLSAGRLRVPARVLTMRSS